MQWSEGARGGCPQGLPVVTEAVAVTGAEAGHCCSVNAIARCTGYVVSGGGDAAIRVWRARTLAPVKCVACPDAPPPW